jgi:hypothetical protein
MKRFIACAAFGVVSAMAVPAFADGGYLALSLTDDADFKDPRFAGAGSGSRKTIGIGRRLSIFSAEIYGSGFSGSWARQSFDGRTLGASGRISVPVFPLLNVFGHAGIERTWLSVGDSDADATYKGNQVVVGAGLELKIDFMAHGSLWAGYFARSGKLALSRGSYIDADTGAFAIGVTLGF